MAHRCRLCGGSELEAGGEVQGYCFVACRECGFAFCPELTRKAMAELYAEQFHGPGDGVPEEGWADAGFLQPALERLPRRPLRILDFGTGQSRVPDQLRCAGHRVVAVDVAPPLRPHPDRLTGDLLELQLPRGRFDLVFAYQVFEHLPEPRPVLEELLALRTPDGLVLIHTDMETPEREQGLEHWWYVMPPDHCSFYRHRSFERVLAGRGEQVVWRHPKMVLLGAGTGR